MLDSNRGHLLLPYPRFEIEVENIFPLPFSSRRGKGRSPIKAVATSPLSFFSFFFASRAATRETAYAASARHLPLVSPPLKNLNSFLARSNRAFETKIRVIWVALFLPTLSLQIEQETFLSLSLSFLKNRWYFALQVIIWGNIFLRGNAYD